MKKRTLLPAISFVLTGLLIPVVEATAVTSPQSLPALQQLHNSAAAVTWQQELKLLVAGAAIHAIGPKASLLRVPGKAAGGVVKDP